MIEIIFGKPGAGKTAYMVADCVGYMNGSHEAVDLYSDCVSQINQLNAFGAKFATPSSPPVYSNFPITVSCGVRPGAETYYIDGFHMGFINDNVPVMSVLPGARIYLAEAQRYYNSRRSKDLPDWVSRFYEEHRHFGLNIMLDVQRPGLIDVNIRELCNEFVEVQGLEHKLDKSGNILSTDFYLRIFDDWKYVDKYITNGGSDKCYIETVKHFEGNVFDCYESQSYYNQFVPTQGDFFTVVHPHGKDALENAELSQIMYQQTPPDGFYVKGGARNVSKFE